MLVHAVPLTNCTDGELRTDQHQLKNDANVTRGRLEICNNNVWFSIYDSYSWSRPNSVTASLACRLLGHSNSGVYTVVSLLIGLTAVIHDVADAVIYSIRFLEKPQLPVYLLDFSCSISSETLLNCVNYNSIALSPSSEIGISCVPRKTGLYLRVP